MTKAKLQYRHLTSSSKSPDKAHAHDAAYDLYADCPTGPITIARGHTAIVPTGMAIMPPEGWCCNIRGRSGMNSKGKLVALGLVDAFYTGPWGIVLHNSTGIDIEIKHHDKIAQFTVSPVYESELEIVPEDVPFDLPQQGIVRGGAGFGSTGEK